MNNRFTLLRLPNALRCRFPVASEILKQLEMKLSQRPISFTKLTQSTSRTTRDKFFCKNIFVKCNLNFEGN
ncbi:MAG: hypothetical protein LBJ00_02740 [Planctomycetaceae bacterium]|nr:hypothetical protein [Planctomycetaceae bacterium]